MIDLILENLQIIGFVVGLLCLAMISNTCFGLWYNIKLLKNNFEKSKLFSSVLKFFVFAIGLSALSILITLIPVYIQFSGIEFPPEIYDIANISIIVLTFSKAIIKYTGNAITKLNNILDGSGSIGK